MYLYRFTIENAENWYIDPKFSLKFADPQKQAP